MEELYVPPNSDNNAVPVAPANPMILRTTTRINDKSIQVNPTKIVQIVNCSPLFGRFIAPFRLQINGPTCAGKSLFIAQLLLFRDQIFSETFENIYFCVPQKTLVADKEYITRLKEIVPNISIICNFPNFDDLGIYKDSKKHKLIIIEDQMSEAFQSSDLMTVMIRDSHHVNCRKEKFTKFNIIL